MYSVFLTVLLLASSPRLLSASFWSFFVDNAIRFNALITNALLIESYSLSLLASLRRLPSHRISGLVRIHINPHEPYPFPIAIGILFETLNKKMF